MSLIQTLADYFKTCPVIQKQNKYFTIDGTRTDYDNISIQITNIQPTVVTDILGITAITSWSINFNLYIYTNNEEQRSVIDNNDFAEELSTWIVMQNITRDLPSISGKGETKSMKSTSFGLFETYENGDCLYLLQCNIETV